MAPPSDENGPVAADSGPTADDHPDGYVRVEPRADGTWGVAVKGLNQRNVWTNGEGWDLQHALEQARHWFPHLTIRVITDPTGATAPTLIRPGQPVS